jgi:hypothetical protein
MTYEQWVEATKKGISLEGDAEDRTTLTLDATAYDAFSGGIEEEETPNPEALEIPDPPSAPGPRGLFKKPLSQPSLSK